MRTNRQKGIGYNATQVWKNTGYDASGWPNGHLSSPWMAGSCVSARSCSFMLHAPCLQSISQHSAPYLQKHSMTCFRFDSFEQWIIIHAKRIRQRGRILQHHISSRFGFRFYRSNHNICIWGDLSVKSMNPYSTTALVLTVFSHSMHHLPLETAMLLETII